MNDMWILDKCWASVLKKPVTTNTITMLIEENAQNNSQQLHKNAVSCDKLIDWKNVPAMTKKHKKTLEIKHDIMKKYY